MKSIYIGYFKPSEADFKDMWQNGVFVFDTNVLLNLYRYSEETREQLLKIIGQFKDRIWIPRKVADEFFDNRLEVLSKQIQEYDNVVKTLDKVENDLSNSRQHPFVTSNSLQKVQELFVELKAELLENKEALLARSNDDAILHQVGELFNGKVGDGFSQADLDAIYVEGAKRAEKKIPPGFRDVQSKASSGDNYRIYGDLILWKQILEKASTVHCGVIFISDDKKDDWWLEFHGRKIGPHPYLIQEFHEKTKGLFFMYTVDKFIEYASKFLETQVSSAIIEEVRDISETISAERLSSPLSPREMEILECVTRGMSNKQIAYYLGISHQTVKNHMTAILSKLNLEDRTQAAVYALRQGWVRLQEDEGEGE